MLPVGPRSDRLIRNGGRIGIGFCHRHLGAVRKAGGSVHHDSVPRLQPAADDRGRCVLIPDGDQLPLRRIVGVDDEDIRAAWIVPVVEST